jgi:hypothetical protein
MGKQLTVDQRAWVGPSQLNTVVYKEGKRKSLIEGPVMKGGCVFSAEIKLINSGKTPALKLRSYMIAKNLKKGEKLTITKPEEDKWLKESNWVLQPNTTYKIDMTSANMIPSQSDIISFETGDKVFHLVGMAEYNDIFGNNHFTRFCYYLLPDLSGFTCCPYYNETDD